MMAAIDGGLVLDVLLMLIVLGAMGLGWRQGALASALSIIGVIAGGIVGLELAPPAMDLVEGRAARLIIGVAVLIGLVVVGHTVGGVAGQSLRNRMRSPMAVGLDSGFGAVIQAVAALLVSWMVALPLATVLPGQFGDSIRGSTVLATVDDVAPESLAGLPSSIVRRIDDSGVPAAIAPFEQRPVHDDTPADPAVIDQAVVDRIRPSIVRVLGEAPQCRRMLQGTGFVVAPDLVVTNAHVVAGVTRPEVEVAGSTVVGQVVVYDPDLDIAVIDVDTGGAPRLVFDRTAGQKDDVAVLGYPNDGPYNAQPGRIRSKQRLRSPDIYGNGTVIREVFAVRTLIRPGNSGGPIITHRGEVAGMVFAASVSDSETGYVLTADQVADAAATGMTRNGAVGTGRCVA